MPILLDIGNTAVTFGLYDGGRLLEFGSLLYDGIPLFANKCSIKKTIIDKNVVISSVVPKLTQKAARAFASLKGSQILIAGENLPIPVKHRYKSPEKLGKDRLVNIYGALRIYKPPVLVIDYGTAITFDYVDAKGIFRGGMIVPGPEVSFQALTERAALLPKKLRLPKKAGSFLGRDTYECMASGILEGYGALTDGLAAKFREHFGPMKVLATGGFATHLKPYTNAFNVFDPQHSIKSLLFLYKDWAAGKK